MFNVFVLCGGKCGSSTLLQTFKQNNYDVIKIHNNTNYRAFTGNTNSIFDVIDLSCKHYKNVYIIDVYRTPIERKMSSLFANINIHIPNYNELSINEISAKFNDLEFLKRLENYHSIDAALTHYNLPLFDTFDFDKKYVMVKQDNKIFIKLLFKDIQNWNIILSEIFKTPIIMHNANLTKNKQIYNLYNQFKDNYKVPKEYVTQLSETDKAFKIYNTEQEQKMYIQKWLLNSC